MTARPTLDLDKLSYKHRMDASGLLVSKGNNLRDAAIVSQAAQKKNRTYVQGAKRGEFVDVALVLAAIAYYDMALVLMRPFDPNYSAVANWKCNALRDIGQYADALAWYEEIVRIDKEMHGGTASGDATAESASKQMVKYRGKANEPLHYRVDDLDDFVEPPFTLYAQQCLLSLAKRKYADAALHFEQGIGRTTSASTLKREWEALVGAADFADVSISLEKHLFDWKGKSKRDLGWCYFSVSGPGFNEGISFVVGGSDSGDLAVRRIEFGRP